MTIAVLGDLHGDFRVLKHLHTEGILCEGDTLIQLGDFGVTRRILDKDWAKDNLVFPWRTLFVDGNHENYDVINRWDTEELTEVQPNLFYVPRGYVMNMPLLGTVGFLGGAESVDKAWRATRGPLRDWWVEERITPTNMATLLLNVARKGNYLDYLFTHAPALRTIRENFPPLDRRWWRLPMSWEDESAITVDAVVECLLPRNVVSGHMHKSVDWAERLPSGEERRHRILDIAEFQVLAP